MKKPKSNKGNHKRRKAAIARSNNNQRKAVIIETIEPMTVNFFQVGCQEPPISALEFGLCDDQNGRVAYTDTTDSSKWVAWVENPEAKQIMFTAVDNCIEILREDGNAERKCDALLTYTDNIVLWN